jgi:hypothetical protein
VNKGVENGGAGAWMPRVETTPHKSSPTLTSSQEDRLWRLRPKTKMNQCTVI